MSKEAGTDKKSLLSEGVDFLKGCREELSKVSSPTRQETIQITIVTLILMVVIALALGLMDMVFGSLMTQLLS